MNQLPGLLEAVAATQGAGRAAAVVLLCMSVAAWSQILGKGLSMLWRWRRRYLDQCQWLRLRRRESVIALTECLASGAEQRLALAGWHAWQQLGRRPELSVNERQAWLSHALLQQQERERLRLEKGLALLATIGTSAPFVGLFGTVWGIYHALLAIGLSGTSTLAQVATPIGEALVMTAFGLLVALPAVLAYNLFTRLLRRDLAQLQDRCRTLLALLADDLQLLPLAPAASHPAAATCTAVGERP